MTSPDFTNLNTGESETGPLVSVIVPAFNCESFVEAAVASILAQECDKLEIVIVDDRSTDATWSKIMELRATFPQIVACKNKHSKGPSGARNTGLDEARGEFIAFLDADDVWLPKHLGHGLEFLNSNSDVGVVFYNFNVVNYETQECYSDWFSWRTGLSALKTRSLEMGHELIQSRMFGPLVKESFIHLQSMIVRYRVCEGLRFDEKVMFREDCDFCIKLAVEKEAVFAFKNVVTGIYYRHETSLTKEKSDHQSVENIERGLKQAHGNIYLFEGYQRKYRLNADERGLVKKALHENYLKCTYLYRSLGRFSESLKALQASLKHGYGVSQVAEFLKIMSGKIFFRAQVDRKRQS